MPGAAHLANTASSLARNSGFNQPVSRLIPPSLCGPTVTPRRRARSSSLKLPSGFSTRSRWSANFLSSSGRYCGVTSVSCPAAVCSNFGASGFPGSGRRGPRSFDAWSASWLISSCRSAGRSAPASRCAPTPSKSSNGWLAATMHPPVRPEPPLAPIRIPKGRTAGLRRTADRPTIIAAQSYSHKVIYSHG